jgi:hypothetical protein
MKNFSKELLEYLAGPPRIVHTDFARKAGMTKSKLSRLLSGRFFCDRATLDAIVTAIPERDCKSRVVTSYIRDLISPATLACVEGNGKEPFADLTAGLSRKGQAAVRALSRSDSLRDVERILIDLATALGVET